MLMQRSQMWAFLPGRGGVTLFYKLLMCPPATTSIGGTVQWLQVHVTRENCGTRHIS